ncbi:MAG TPA: tRNA uridine-5-carboxymethylaminomethyl(34) synthesis GTPase MnmE [Caulobacteraceae bacterium]|nr:tRNA uridine-5-carboxymethylaminomethyl(34) synthesis GTPase MnmE [Caulobacteraceae bacterium]
MRDTIFALATAAGRAAVAVVRISGPEAGRALRALAGRMPAPRRAAFRKLHDPDGALIDEALVLWFPAPASYTGEDVAELQLHGGAAVVGAVARALSGQGLRLAAPGEFTRRAFEAGRLDLDQAEAVADLVDAETEAQARQALRQLEGALGRRYAAWRGLLSEALAYLEAAVDFPDEDVPADVAARAAPALTRLSREMQTALADARRGERVRDGYRIALVGAPNVGKSRLLNAFVERDAAIVTPTPGTTRDVIEASLTLAGYRVLLADMAGVRETAEAIEAEGVRRARAWAEAADLRLWVVDASASSQGGWREAEALVRSRDMMLLNKSDLAAGCDRAAAIRAAGSAGLETAAVSAATGEGLAHLRRRLSERVAADLSGGEFPAVTRERHALLLGEGLGHVRRAEGRLEEPELAAEDLRLAARALERVTGRIGSEDILDVIFSSFCIGK